MGTLGRKAAGADASLMRDGLFLLGVAVVFISRSGGLRGGVVVGSCLVQVELQRLEKVSLPVINLSQKGHPE